MPSSPDELERVDRLRKEFEYVPTENTTVQNLNHFIQQKLNQTMLQNQLRTDFQNR